MTQKIPREVLWIDKEIKELMNIPLFKALHEVFIIFEEQNMLYPGFEVIILNEVGYQVTLCPFADVQRWIVHQFHHRQHQRYHRFGMIHHPDMGIYLALKLLHIWFHTITALIA